MLFIVLKALLVLVLLWVVLWVYTRFFHQALYTQVPEGLHWRTAAAASAVWVWGVLLPLLAFGLFGWLWPISFDDYFVGKTSTTPDEIEFQAFLVTGPDGLERRYELRKESRGLRQERQYVLGGVERLDPGLLVPEDQGGTTRTFKGVYVVTNEDQREEKQVTFTPRRATAGLRFNSELGVMALDEFGVLRPVSAGGFLLRMVVFLLLGAVWFAVFAFLLEFHRTHAIASALAAVFLWVFLLNMVTLRVVEAPVG
jgi:hypothetical protein